MGSKLLCQQEQKMIDINLPFALAPHGKINYDELKHAKHHFRNLSDMAMHFSDRSSVDVELSSNPLIYEFWELPFANSNIGLNYSLTTIYPGIIGKEFYMTKGHSHRPISNEVYVVLSGEGLLLIQNKEKYHLENMLPGNIYSIPAGWAHRTINTSNKPLVFFSIWAKGIKHNYKKVGVQNFNVLILKGKKSVVIANRS